MGWNISLPSVTDIGRSLGNAASGAAQGLRDFGSAAVERTADLGRAGLDAGRRAVETVRAVDVRDAAATVRRAIGDGTEAAREGIRDGVEWTGRQIHAAADTARGQIEGDGVIATAARGAISQVEHNSRLTLGVAGGVAREAVGLAGTAGQLATTGVEMQVSSEARADYGQRIADGVTGTVRAAGDYAADVARDPTRIGRDLGGAAAAGRDFATGQVDRYAQAYRDGKGPETLGIDLGTVATYVVPVGGGPVRGAVTSAVRGGGEAVVREGAEALARRGAGALDDAARGTGAAGGAVHGLADIARRTGTSEVELKRIMDMVPADRPHPAEYLPPERIAGHRAAFDEGASRFTLQGTVDKYGLGQRDGTTFVMTRAEADGIIQSTAGDPRRLEDALGLPRGQLDEGTLVRVDFPSEALDDLGLRMPQGIEAGANDKWMPGGYLPSGANEAVLDGVRAQPGQYSITRME